MNKLTFYTAWLIMAISIVIMPYRTSQSFQPKKDNQEITSSYRKRLIMEEVQLDNMRNTRVVELLDAAFKHGNKLFSDSSMIRINNIANKYGLKPSWIVMVMFKESRINPQAINPFSKNVGLIQWSENTAKYLGTSTKKLYKMSIYEQLEYVDRYIAALTENRRCYINSYEDFHLSIFYPKALGKGPDYIIGHKNTDIVKYNKVMANKNGTITVKDFKNYALRI